MTRPPHSRVWQPIEEHALARLDALVQTEPDRLAKMTHDVAGIHFDWSKTHLDAVLIERFVELAEASGFAAARAPIRNGAAKIARSSPSGKRDSRPRPRRGRAGPGPSDPSARPGAALGHGRKSMRHGRPAAAGRRPCRSRVRPGSSCPAIQPEPR